MFPRIPLLSEEAKLHLSSPAIPSTLETTAQSSNFDLERLSTYSCRIMSLENWEPAALAHRLPPSINRQRSSAPEPSQKARIEQESTRRRAQSVTDPAGHAGRARRVGFRTDSSENSRKGHGIEERTHSTRSQSGFINAITLLSAGSIGHLPRRQGAGRLMKSRKTSRQLVPTEEQISDLFQSKDTGSTNGSSFSGPLGQIYRSGRIRRRSRHDESVWKATMEAGDKWNDSAEFSGISTFWQAILIAGLELHNAVDSLKVLAETGKLRLWMVENVALALGKLTNTIGMSWHWDHERNLGNLSEVQKHSVNFNGLMHRYDTGSRKVWVVLEKLEKIQAGLGQNGACWKGQCLPDAMASVSALYDEFYVYIVCTAQIVLEDSLFCYRQYLSETNLSCVALASRGSNVSDGTADVALAIISGATPAKQRLARFNAMGFHGLSARTAVLFGSLAYKRTFAWPLHEVISAAAPNGPGESHPAKRSSIGLERRYFRRSDSETDA